MPPELTAVLPPPELFKNHDFGAGIVSRNGRRCTGTTIAENGNISFDVPLGRQISFFGVGCADDRQRGGDGCAFQEITLGDVGHLQYSSSIESKKACSGKKIRQVRFF